MGRIAEAGLPEVEGYEILAELGYGGMGVVYKAHQQRLSRFVALKMIRAGSLAKPEDLARFRIEAEAVAKQRHPNIIQIFDIGEVGGLPFVALELLEGGDLDAFLGGTPQPGEPSARLLATLAGAVHAAHQAGIIHRDLKPANVMLRTDGSLCLIDFGLAKANEGDVELTGTREIFGTPYYMSPEQGHAELIDARSDLYSLGIVFFEMLTGKKPYTGGSAMEVIYKHKRAELPELAPQFASYEPIIRKLLAKAPVDRFQSARELLDAIADLKVPA